MRRRLVLQAVAVTTMVTLAFLVPLAMLVRDLAADRALTRAERDAESVARFVAVLAPTRGVDGALAALGIGRLSDSAVSVILPDGAVLGVPVPEGEDLTGARDGTAFRAEVDGGQAVYVPLVQADGTTAVVRVFVAAADLTRGVGRSVGILAGLGVTLTLLALLFFDRLGRSVVRAVDDLHDATERIGQGLVATRVEPSGPEEIATVGRGLNRLASRIESMLQDERETAANLSHRLRTPLAAARLSADAVADHDARDQLLADLDRLERTVDHVIDQVRRTGRQGSSRPVDIGAATRRRVAFWAPLAEDQDRVLDLSIPDGRVMARVPDDDIEAVVDAMIGNALSHTPVGTPVGVKVLREATGDVVLAVEDGGPGFPDASVMERGRSDGDSTGLGLDIVASTARAAGGSVQIGVSRRLGGAMVVVRLPSAADEPTQSPSARSDRLRR